MSETSPRPLIGISAYWRPVDFGPWRGFPVSLVPQGYVEGVREAGGLPFLVPPIPEVAAEPALALDRLDGLLLTGGEDLDPALYGAERHPATGAANEARDRAELALLQAALERDLPVLAVCRGAQLLNVAYGGDLVQHLEEPGEHLPQPGTWGRHPVRVRGGRLAELAGEEVATVASQHHQTFGRIGDGLVVTAEAPDGLAEALEDPSRSFALGVLWHPEEHARDGGAPLFRGLVEAARAYAAARGG
ncbi:MAG TPA: gamma-glutamyl-gamma-aminobutyrate hydrolase family protein [Gaiellaceae bacterium]|nr:gamma-glutamyl-gamma-aminobutyrate hydrolase family protein [Gaiellaceae bacterium]